MESKINLTVRLQREKRWSEASLFKDTALREFRSKGMKRGEAQDAAWAALEAAYPPLPVVAKVEEEPEEGLGWTEDEDEVEALLERVGEGQAPDLTRDTLWVYGNLANRRVKPDSAPSLGAWSLLLWARKYQNRFFEQVLPKAMGVHEGDEEQNQRRERKSIEEIREVLERMKEFSST